LRIKISENQNIRESRYQTIKISENQDIRKSRYQRIKICIRESFWAIENQDIRESRYQRIKISENQDIRKSKYQRIKISENQDIRELITKHELVKICNLPILTMMTVEGGLEDAVHLKVTVSPTLAVTFTGP
jgi:hypothetical protein